MTDRLTTDADTPDPTLTIHQALSLVMRDVQYVGKNERNTTPGQNYKFRGIDAVLNAVGPALRRHGIVVMPEVLETSYRDVLTSKDKRSREVTVRVRYTFHGPNGDKLSCVVPGESMDSGDKGSAKAMSVALRIALIQALVLPTDEPDPDSYTYERHADAVPEPQPPVQLTPARLARDSLRAACIENKWDTKVVAQNFKDTHGGVDLRDVNDVEVIRAFRETLFSRGDHHWQATPGAEPDTDGKADALDEGDDPRYAGDLDDGREGDDR